MVSLRLLDSKEPKKNWERKRGFTPEKVPLSVLSDLSAELVGDRLGDLDSV